MVEINPPASGVWPRFQGGGFTGPRNIHDLILSATPVFCCTAGLYGRLRGRGGAGAGEGFVVRNMPTRYDSAEVPTVQGFVEAGNVQDGHGWRRWAGPGTAAFGRAAVRCFCGEGYTLITMRGAEPPKGRACGLAQGSDSECKEPVGVPRWWWRPCRGEVFCRYRPCRNKRWGRGRVGVARQAHELLAGLGE